MNIDVQENFVAPRSLKELLRSGDLDAAEAIFRFDVKICSNQLSMNKECTTYPFIPSLKMVQGCMKTLQQLKQKKELK